MPHISEYEVEDILIDRLEGIGYKFIKLDNYDDVLANFREQLAKFNAKKLAEKGYDYREILTYFFEGINIENVNTLE